LALVSAKANVASTMATPSTQVRFIEETSSKNRYRNVTTHYLTVMVLASGSDGHEPKHTMTRLPKKPTDEQSGPAGAHREDGFALKANSTWNHTLP
jgi:hypothetical protein